MNIQQRLVVLSLAVFFTACDNEIDPVSPLVNGGYQAGILISNEGPFNNGTGTVTFISDDLERVESAIYNQVNNDNLGNIVQSIGFADDKAYIIANVSNKIIVVNRFTFEKEAEITTGLNNPRYFVAANGKGYVTNWGDTADDTDDYVAIVNLETNEVEGGIAVDLGPEEMSVVAGAKIYVAHQGAFGQNDRVSIIDATIHEVSTTIIVGDVPNSMQVDIDGNLWVLCGGKPSFFGEETPGSLYKINTTDDSAEKIMDFETLEHPNHLKRSGDHFFYVLNGEVVKLTHTAIGIIMTTEFSDLNIYAMEVLDGKLYVTDAKDFASKGSLNIYDLTSKEQIQTIDVGIVPGGIYFN